MRLDPFRRERRSRAVKDRVSLSATGVGIAVLIVGFGWVGRQIGNSVMLWIMLGLLGLVIVAFVVVCRRLMERGIRPPTLKQLQESRDQPSDDPA